MLLKRLSEQYTSATGAVLKIIPQDEIDLCIARGQRYSQEKWWWGNRTNLWVEYALAAGLELKIGDAQRALSQVSGIPQRTLRYYADHARFFEPEIQEHYEILPFSHFATAKRFGDRWNEVLEESLDHLEKYQKLPSSEHLEWKFSRNAEPVLEINQTLDEASSTFGKAVQDSPDRVGMQGGDPQASEYTARDWISDLNRSVSAMYELVAPLPISNDTKINLRNAIQNLNEVLEEAIREISVPDPARKDENGI